MALTKVSGGILDPGINVAGIVTATGFDGPFTGGSSKHITAGIITATGFDLNGNGDISGNLVIGGNLTANGDFTTLNTTLREVELLRVDAQDNTVTAGIITQRGTGNILDLYDTSSAVFSVRDGGNIIMGASAGSITPHAPLHIRTATTGAITTLLKLHGPFTSNTGSEGTAIDFGTASDTSTGARIIGSREAAGAKGALRFCTGRENDAGFNDGHVVIDETGNVGIHTNNPDAKLDVNGTSKFQANATFLKKIILPDSTDTSDGRLVFGATNDMMLFHYGGANYIDITTNLNIRGSSSGNIIKIKAKQSEESIIINPAGAIDLYHNNVKTAFTGQDQWIVYGRTANSGMIEIASNQGANNNDRFRIHKTSGASRLTIQNYSTGSWVENIRFNSDGEVSIATGSNTTNRLTFGGGINIYHDGNMKFENGTGYLKLQSSNALYIDGSALYFRNAGGTNRWQINSSGHLLPGAVGSYDIGSTGAEIGNVYIADDKKVFLGSDQDFTLHHNNAHAIVKNTTGRLYVLSDDLWFKNQGDNSNLARFLNGDSVLLYYAGNLKLQTLPTGISVTGKVVASGEIEAAQDYPDFRPTLDFNFEAEKKLDSRIVYYRTGPASYHDESGKVVIVGDNQPRFDHTFPEYWYHGNVGDSNSRGISKGLLMEPTRTNLYKNNHSLSTANDHASITQTVNTTETTAPDGTFTATKVDITGGDQWTRFDVNNGLDAVGVNFTDTFSTSIYMKTVGTSNVNVSLDFGDAGNATFSVGQEWKRYAISNVHQNYGGSTKFIDLVYQGDVYIWGLQCENGSHPTSYIPTSGTTMTRGNEYAVIDGEDFTDFYNPVESSVLAVGTMHRPAAAQGQLNIFHIGDDNEDGHGVFRENGTKDVWYHIRNNNNTPSGGNLNPSGFGDWDEGEEARIAIAFKDGDQAISVNGGNQITAAVTSSYPTQTSTISKMWIGSHGTGSFFEGIIKRIAYYPKLLTDNQLNTLTA